MERALEKQSKLGSAQPSAVRNCKKVFVGGLPNKASKAELHDFLSAFGQLADLFMPVGKEGLNRGFAFASFVDSASVQLLLANADRAILRAKIVR